MSDERMLPAEFADLEPFAEEWIFAGAHERMQKRINSSMEELQAFYDGVYPRAEDAMKYLDPLDLDDLSDEAIHLMRLLYALSAVSLSVELFKAPRDPNSGTTYLDWVEEPPL